MSNLRRLLSPRSIAVIGGGPWCEAVVRECQAAGFGGPIWPVHPKKPTVGGLAAVRCLADLPSIPDAAFIGVNREATIGIVADLARLGCGGAVCFANGFREAGAELEDGAALQDELVSAAGEMAILGPNCYGFVNGLDGVALWPDMHGITPQARGVAIVGQSSNVLINLTMQTRGLPLAAVVSAGNQAKCTMAQIGLILLQDPRITALGLHIEGVVDLPALVTLAEEARALGKPVVALKVGRSEQAQAATVSHTASLAGSNAGARALLSRLGFAEVSSPAALIETLKIMHVTGGLPSARIVSASCSGGEASLMADLGEAAGVVFPVLSDGQRERLRAVLGPRIALANPLDYNTHIWGNEAALADCFAGLADDTVALVAVVLDFPRADRFSAPDWDKVVAGVRTAKARTGKPMAIIASLAEGMPETLARTLISEGIVPLCGMGDALSAIAAAAGSATRTRADEPIRILAAPAGGLAGDAIVLGEAEAKRRLSDFSLRVPRASRAISPEEAGRQALAIGFPVVLKGEGIAHKSEAGAVVLGLRDEEAVVAAARSMAASTYLVEEMIEGGVAELLIGVVRDPAHGFVLTLGMGGVLTELLADTTSLLVPASETEVRQALLKLKAAALLTGFRGRPKADVEAVVAAVMAVQCFVAASAGLLHEVEINPLICGPEGAVAADALIRIGEMP